MSHGEGEPRGATSRRQPVLYVTERCVFRLGPRGPVLVEIAPGIDLETEILAHMDFRPEISPDLRPMDERIFTAGPMGLRDDLLSLPLASRFDFDARRNTLFLNFERLTVRRPRDVEDIRAMVETTLAPIGHKVFTVVNYDEFVLAPEVEDAYLSMVRDVVDRFYLGVTRYTTSAFLRMKLGDALARRQVAPHVYESAGEAEARLADLGRR